MKNILTSCARLITFLFAASFMPFAYAQISINHYDDGSWPCGRLRAISNDGNIWDITIYYTVSGRDGSGARTTSDKSNSMRVHPNGVNQSPVTGWVDCTQAYTVTNISWTGKNVSAQTKIYQDSEDEALRRIIAREEQKRRDVESAIRQREEAARKKEEERRLAIKNAEEGARRFQKEDEDRKIAAARSSLEAFDREMDDLTRNSTSCRHGKSIIGSNVDKTATRRYFEKCLEEEKMQKNKANAAASEARDNAAAEQARYNDYQQDMARRDAEYRQQEALRLQREELRKRQAAQEEERLRAQRQAAAKVDVDAAVAKHSGEIATRMLENQNLQKSNSNLADLIKNLK